MSMILKMLEICVSDLVQLNSMIMVMVRPFLIGEYFLLYISDYGIAFIRNE